MRALGSWPGGPSGFCVMDYNNSSRRPQRLQDERRYRVADLERIAVAFRMHLAFADGQRNV